VAWLKIQKEKKPNFMSKEVNHGKIME